MLKRWEASPENVNHSLFEHSCKRAETQFCEIGSSSRAPLLEIQYANPAKNPSKDFGKFRGFGRFSTWPISSMRNLAQNWLPIPEIFSRTRKWRLDRESRNPCLIPHNKALRLMTPGPTLINCPETICGFVKCRMDFHSVFFGRTGSLSYGELRNLFQDNS